MEGETGQLFSNLKKTDIDAVALDSKTARRLVAVDKYWTGVVESKSELLPTHTRS